MTPGISRRNLFGAGGAAVAAGGLGLAGGEVLSADEPVVQQVVAFAGEHQAGITTPMQDRLHFAAFDLTTDRRGDLVSLLQDWTTAARAMSAGQDVGTYGAVGGPLQAPPEDTGEALGLPPSRLTLTVGFGAGMFDRFGLAGQRPDQLADLPHFAGDALRPAISGGDVAIQACADDPQVAVHAIRQLARIAFGRASMRWSQLGFGRTSSTSTSQATPRNLFGFKDGTANVKGEDTDATAAQVWAQAGDGPAWMDGGSYLVSRKIMMQIETWDREPLYGQEQIIGRTKGEGGPLSGGSEHAEPDFTAHTDDGALALAKTSHVRLAHPDMHGGAKLLRRGYNLVDGSDELGQLAAGLFFLAYQRDPRKQFVPIQTALAAADAMNEYVVHVSSGLYACPPGVGSDGWWGDSLLG